MPRVVITGLGMISALGLNVPENWASLCEGRSGIGPISSVDTTNLKFNNGAEVSGFEPEKHFPGSSIDMLDRFARFAVVAAHEAMGDARLSIPPESSGRAAVITGSCLGGQSTQDAGFDELYRKGNPRTHPLTIPRTMANAGASQIAMDCGIRGPVFTISTACSSANHAIGQAFHMIRNGMVDVAICGGSEAPFSYGLLKAWEAMRVISPETCRPFSKDRQGMILGEGAGMLVLESLEHAQVRQARIYGEIVGFGMSSDASHITKPSAEGAAMAIRSALLDARVSAERVGYINAHGTGTSVNDPTEASAIRSVFGEHAKDVAVSSTKSMAAQPHAVDMTWNRSTSTVSGYYVYRGTSSAGPFSKLNTSSVPNTTYTDSTVQSGRTYYYVVTAVDSAGRESAYSNVATAVIPTP